MTNLFSKVTSKIKSNLMNLIERFKKNGAFKKIIFITIILFIFLLSGYAPLSLYLDSEYTTILNIIFVLINIIVFVFLLDFSKLKKQVKNRKIPFSYFVLFLLAFSLILTMLATKDTNNLVAYIGYGLCILNGFLIAKLFSIERFVKLYTKTLFCLTSIGLAFYFFFIIGKTNLSILPTFKSSNNHEYANFFFLAYQNTGSFRFQGFTWEPGLMSSFLMIGIIFEIIYDEKINILHFIVFTLGTLLTFSTFAFILYPLVILLLLNKIIKNRKIFNWIFAIGIVVLLTSSFFSTQIIEVLAKLMPSIFGKFTDNDAILSLTTRIYSPYLDITIFIKNPIWGVGITNANQFYQDLIDLPKYNMLVDSQTSSTCLMMAQFGILGLIPTLLIFISIFKIKDKRFNTLTKILFSLFILLIWNKEPHTRFAFDWVLLFILIKTGFEKEESALLFEEPSSSCLLVTINKNNSDAILKRNIIGSFVIKGLALLVSFFSLPVYISYFSGDAVLGVWLTLLSILQWIMTFDLGLGNGLKNKLVEALSKDDKEKAKELVSCTYFSTILIGAIIMVAGILFFSLIDLNKMFNISPIIVSPLYLKLSVIIAFISICLEFILKNVISIYQALQKQAISSSFSLISSFLLICYASIFKFAQPNLQILFISIAYLFIINLPFLFGTLNVFNKNLKFAKPSIKYFTLKGSKAVMSLGLAFFVIQISLLVINSTNNFLISNIFGSETTVIFTKYYRPYNIIYSLFALISVPYWAMVAKAKSEGDIVYVRKMFKEIVMFALLFAVLLTFMTIILQPFLNLWLKEDSITVDWKIAILLALNSFELIFIGAFTSIANGLSQIKPQLFSTLAIGIVKIPLLYLINMFFHDNISWSFIILLDDILLLVPLIIVPLFLIKSLYSRKARKQT